MSKFYINIFSCILFFLQEYHQEIDKLKSELQAARDKDGVFLPKDAYDEQNKAFERQQEEIKNFTIQLKQKEEELEKFMVRWDHLKLFFTSQINFTQNSNITCFKTIFIHRNFSKRQRQNWKKLRKNETRTREHQIALELFYTKQKVRSKNRFILLKNILKQSAN